MSLRGNYRQATPRRRKLFLVLMLSLIPLVAAVFFLNYYQTVTTIGPFKASTVAIISPNPPIANQNFTATWTLTNQLTMIEERVSVLPYSNSSTITLWGVWPQIIILPNQNPVNVTATFNATQASIGHPVTIGANFRAV